MKHQKIKINLIASFLIALFLVGCGPMVNTTVILNRDKYTPKLNPNDYKALSGKRILFHSIVDKSTNTTNLSYYNPEKTLGYSLYYKNPGNSMAQPVVSFFWYALQKGFERAGIVITPGDPIYDAEMTMTFRSVTDREVVYDVVFTKMGKLLYEKTYTVKTPSISTDDVTALENRAYDMIDAMVKTILDDPDFKKVVS